eukprot:2548165-Rhodomonas_salina.1
MMGSIDAEWGTGGGDGDGEAGGGDGGRGEGGQTWVVHHAGGKEWKGLGDPALWNSLLRESVEVAELPGEPSLCDVRFCRMYAVFDIATLSAKAILAQRVAHISSSTEVPGNAQTSNGMSAYLRTADEGTDARAWCYQECSAGMVSTCVSQYAMVTNSA